PDDPGGGSGGARRKAWAQAHDRLVYNIRSASNASARGKSRVLPRLNGATNGWAPRADTNVEAQLRAAIAEVGLSRARQILEEVEATFAGYRGAARASPGAARGPVHRWRGPRRARPRLGRWSVVVVLRFFAARGVAERRFDRGEDLPCLGQAELGDGLAQ